MAVLKNFELNIRMIKDRLKKSTLVEIGDDFCLMNIREDEQREDLGYPCRLEGTVILFCVKGSVSLSVNLNEYEIGDGQLIICTKGDILKVSKPQIEQDVERHIIMLVFSQRFTSDLRIDFKRILNKGLVPMLTPIIKMEESTQELISDHLRLIAKVAIDKGELYNDSVRSLVSSLVSVLAGIWIKEVDKMSSRNQDYQDTRTSHKRLVFEQFMKLVTENYSRERQMAFYADKLCLSPKYLSKLVKEVSGRHAPEWIDEYVILEAKHLLKYSDMPVKEVVYRLNFPNQTVFYKYFKAHTGLTPTEYRNG